MTIAYDGWDYHGWQAQNLPEDAPPDATPLRTVQAVLMEAMWRTMAQRLHVQGASRTDAGVHALGQVAHFECDTYIPLDRLAMAINSRLPRDVEVLDIRETRPDFDATSDAVSKQYRYRIWTARRRPLMLRHMFYHCWHELDVTEMNYAAARLEGEHDFAGFAAASHGRETTVRRIFRCKVEAHRPDPQTDTMFTRAPQVHIVVSGNGFLYNMVRIIAGTLVEVGRGRFNADHMNEILKTTNRALAGPTLPAHGLCLEWIRYPEDPDPLASA
ncbi:MAG: tRNA pseudouridine(38-40) synthase TruA [Phycisphaera sp.]|nr:tRNA pseudouridine(38-40) synthase TruA [Phycisphaera sp.]